MRVLLLGATGNTGLRCVTALLTHKHTVTLYVRNLAKLHSLLPASLLAQVSSIVIGDATDAAGIKRALLEHEIEGIIDVAGNMVFPWRDYVLPQIATAVARAAVEVGEERGAPLRVWVTSGLLIMDISMEGASGLISDYFPRIGMAQHDATRRVIEPIPISSLRWSLLAITQMHPADRKNVTTPRSHNLVASAGTPPDWPVHTWLEKIPLIGWHLNLLFVASVTYATVYEEVADFLAEDLEVGGEEWVGKKVALKERAKCKNV